MRYRRARAEAGSFFFTVNLADRSRDLLVEHVDVLRNAMRAVRASHPFEMIAIVVLPEHLHCVWRLPCGDADFPLRWSLIKARFSRSLPAVESIRASRLRKRERGIWQRRYWEHQIRDELDLQRHVDYIHYNPVKHGHVKVASQWPYSSVHHYIRNGWLTPEWGAGGCTIEGLFGE